MGSLNDRLRKLEAKAYGPRHAIPSEVLVVAKAGVRAQARIRGEEPPSYLPEEVQEMRQADLEFLAFEADRWRRGVGWQTPEARELIDGMEEDARRRLELAEELGAALVYEQHDVDVADDEEEGEA